ncbi:hypothetical protein BW723_05650 [Polaribacter reichenbachii]|uniref:Uncharacterized protein n=1 Tax=Polaribacter reichenbachii TaxID=996801 RepID=A0A1B8TYL0_9FLAO|nr:hypothetical protein [Polaribacter reichenbachii]APZ45811.1 hypothetical protein BW723_05650 [Polaribacter reichenbachii]AUC19673.1 hypothetical protein BTO17_13665 [Polaribacter reichenbachii]OBY64757.1 hypothetical protein LPB301_10060 [Polaribacter reichenbachii]|tara:strand:+ start:523 stop:786 length:264 start_codon:yes stop_codon:yes gene_type:complete
MKKLILSLVFVLVTGTSFMNAISTNDEILPTTKEAIEVVEEFGCASDCTRSTRAEFLEAAEVLGVDPNEHIDQYIANYTACYNDCIG